MKALGEGVALVKMTLCFPVSPDESAGKGSAGGVLMHVERLFYRGFQKEPYKVLCTRCIG